MKRAILAALLAAALLAGPSAAREVGNGTAVKDNTGQSISAWDTATNVWRTLVATVQGYLKVQNTAVYRFESTSLFNTTIAAKQLFKTNTPTYAQDISKVTAMMTWSSPADSDSVAFEVFVIGKISGSAADGFDFPIDMNPATDRLDGWLVGPNRAYFRQIPVDTLQLCYASSAAFATGQLAYATGVPYGGMSTMGASFSFAPRYGPAPNWNYYSFHVVNLTNNITEGVTLLTVVKGD